MVLYVFQRKRKEWEFSWVLLVCIKSAFLKTPGCLFCGCVQLHQPWR